MYTVAFSSPPKQDLYVIIHRTLFASWASLVAQLVKNPPAMQETQVPSLGREDPLEEGVAAHSSILAWGVPWTEEPGGYSPRGHTASDMTQ